MQFFEAWVASDKHQRKWLSYHGALRRSLYLRHAGQQLALTQHHWGDKMKFIDIGTYFDPGNWHYQVCFELLFGDVPWWNQETIGDMFESILGMRYLIENEGVPYTTFPFGFAEFLERWCVAVYRWFKCTAWRHTAIKAIRSQLSLGL